jgi:hypothetical protein
MACNARRLLPLFPLVGSVYVVAPVQACGIINARVGHQFCKLYLGES